MKQFEEPVVLSKIEEASYMGHTIREVAEMLGVHYEKLRQFINKEPELRHQFQLNGRDCRVRRLESKKRIKPSLA